MRSYISNSLRIALLASAPVLFSGCGTIRDVSADNVEILGFPGKLSKMMPAYREVDSQRTLGNERSARQLERSMYPIRRDNEAIFNFK